jgi:hypothetical protein
MQQDGLSVSEEPVMDYQFFIAITSGSKSTSDAQNIFTGPREPAPPSCTLKATDCDDGQRVRPCTVG